jgi:hypothetical protein
MIHHHLATHGVAAWIDWAINTREYVDQLVDMIAESQLVVILVNKQYFESALRHQEWEAASRSPTPKLVLRFDDVEIPQTNAGFTIRDCGTVADAPELVLSYINARPQIKLFVSYSRQGSVSKVEMDCDECHTRPHLRSFS